MESQSKAADNCNFEKVLFFILTLKLESVIRRQKIETNVQIFKRLNVR